MYLVVDANVVISCLIAGSWTLKVFLANSLSKKFVLISPEFLFVEVEKHFNEIRERTKLPNEDLAFLIDFMREEIRLIPVEEFEDAIEEAEIVSPDPKDVPYFALAIKFNCPIWSNEKRLKNQNRVVVLNTSEVSRLLGIR